MPSKLFVFSVQLALTNALHGPPPDIVIPTTAEAAMWPSNSYYTVNGGATKTYFAHSRNWRIGKGWTGDHTGDVAFLPVGLAPMAPQFNGAPCDPTAWSMSAYAGGNHIMLTDIIHWVTCVIGPDINLYPAIAAAVPFKGWIQFHLVGVPEWSQNAWYNQAATGFTVWDTPDTFVVGGIDFTIPDGFGFFVANLMANSNTTLNMFLSNDETHCLYDLLCSTGAFVFYFILFAFNVLLYPVTLYLMMKMKGKIQVSVGIAVMFLEGLVIPGMRANRITMAPFYLGNKWRPINDLENNTWNSFLEPLSGVTTLMIAFLFFSLTLRLGKMGNIVYNGLLFVISVTLCILSIWSKQEWLRIGTTDPAAFVWNNIHYSIIFYVNLVSIIVMTIANLIVLAKIMKAAKAGSSASATAGKKMMKWMLLQLPIQVMQIIQVQVFQDIQATPNAVHFPNCSAANFTLFDMELPGTILSYMQVFAIYDYSGGASSSSSSSS